MPAVLTSGRWQFPMPRWPVLGGCRIPGASVWHWCLRTPDTVSMPAAEWRPGPVVRGFATGTKPISRAGDYSRCDMV